MKKLLPFLFLLSTVLICFSACKKDETCGIRVYVKNAQGQKKKNTWVKIDLSPGTPAGNFTDRVPVQLNTGDNGYVDAEFALPGILMAYAYDSANVALVAPPIGQKVIKLEPGENVTVTIDVQ
jgi:hypothetical protein